MEKLNLFIDNRYVESAAAEYYDVYNPSTGEIIARAPKCTQDEALKAVEAAYRAFPAWRDTPVLKRMQVLHNVRRLLVEEMDELTMSVARENGKAWEEAKGDVLKAKEATEHALSMPSLMLGDSMLNASSGYDTVMIRESVGVFLGIVPFNFPAMIPMGWMTPMCIACGNTIVIKASSSTPMTALKIADIYRRAGVPDGVVNIITCGRDVTDVLLADERIRGVSFVGSTKVGLSIYEKASKYGKRVQTLCEAKNHALVMKDAPIQRTAAGIINASFGCAGERCMALPVVVVEEEIADELVAELVRLASKIKVGPAYDKETKLGPVYSAAHKQKIIGDIEKGIADGAVCVLDGRNVVVPGFENGFYLGPTILDHVTQDMYVGQREIFGPVLSIKRVRDFEEGLAVMNANPFANGSVIYTQNGYFAREFAKRTDGGMVGINVGIPVPVGVFPFSGHKKSFFGALHTLGKDGVNFYTDAKCITQHWFTEEEKSSHKVSTWDGTLN
ncbi:MAG: CoA-acylating methylmalonate-semialdehyde dehydrogenase [Clostridia bacterium]|nr:CoA-acylating methylmalonate-semialdehyde dehydrogenase [Clostridia bacterium]